MGQLAGGENFPLIYMWKNFLLVRPNFTVKQKNGALILTIYKAHTCDSLCNKDSI